MSASIPAANAAPSSPLVRVANAHDDDIHAIHLHGSEIISGSKDTAVKIFDKEGRFRRLGSVSPKVDYTRWVTALDGFPDGSWVVGHRNGFLRSRNLKCTRDFFKAVVRSPTPTDGGTYKKRNVNRITGIKCLNNLGERDYNVLIGFPESFMELNLTTKEVVRRYRFEKPEWVYGFAEIRPDTIAAIHGGCLSLLEEKGASWEHVHTLIEEKPPINDERQFISHVHPLSRTDDSIALLTIAYFQGTTEVVDTETGQPIFTNREHENRVWQAVPNTPQTYASCADDALVKIWDIRRPRSVRTLSGHPGRVSALAFQSEHNLVAGTCPDNPHEGEGQGQFYFYDLRK